MTDVILKEVKETIIDATKDKLIEAKEATVEKIGDIKEKLKIAEIKAKKIIDGGKDYAEQRQDEMRDVEKNLSEIEEQNHKVDKVEGSALDFLYNEV